MRQTPAGNGVSDGVSSERHLSPGSSQQTNNNGLEKRPHHAYNLGLISGLEYAGQYAVQDQASGTIPASAYYSSQGSVGFRIVAAPGVRHN